MGIRNKAHAEHARGPQFKESSMDRLDSLLQWGTSCTWVLAIHDLCLWLVMLPAAHTPPGSTLRYAR